MTSIVTPPSPATSPVERGFSRTVIGGRPAEGNLRWTVLPARERSAALELWGALEQRLESGNARRGIPLAVSRDWTETWLTHYGSAVPHEYLVLADARGPVGLTLLTKRMGRGLGLFREKSRHIGTAGERHGESVCVEYNQLLVMPEHRSAFQERLIAHVLQDKSWESFQLDGFTEESAESLQQELPGFEVRRRESPYYDLQAARTSGVDLLDRLGRSTRQNVRRLLRKYGEIETEWAATGSQAREIFAELIELHQARWKRVGQPGAFHSRRFRGFQQTLIDRAFDAPEAMRHVVLFRARHAGATIGCLLLLCDRNRLLDYLSGFADFEAKPSPGVVTHVLAMQEALRRGFDAYDFLVGDKRHKANLSTDMNGLVWAAWRRPTVRSRTIGILRRVKRRWKELRGSEESTRTMPTDGMPD